MDRILRLGLACGLAVTASAVAAGDGFPELRGPYLGQKPPSTTPELFAPGVVSTGYSERIAAFTPDGRELYFMLYGAPHGVILVMEQEAGRWTRPRVAPFSGRYNGEFTLSPDGNTIVFSSNRPLHGGGEPIDTYYSWIVERRGSTWGEPRPFGPRINAEGTFAAYPSISSTGELYFFSDREGSEDIFVSRLLDGEYLQPENLGGNVNSDLDEVDPFIAPDGSYLLFSRRARETRNVDLFVSFRGTDGSWTQAQNLGEPVSSSASEYCPTVTPDGQYLFFTSNRGRHAPYSATPLTYEQKVEILDSPGNGESDIYWVDAEVIRRLRPASLR
jgi:Tol biopolymer transport system component